MSDAITRARLEVDGFTIFDRDATVNAYYQGQSKLVRDQSATMFTLDFTTEQGYYDQALVTAGISDLRLILTRTAAEETKRVYVEYIGAIDA